MYYINCLFQEGVHVCMVIQLSKQKKEVLQTIIENMKRQHLRQKKPRKILTVKPIIGSG